MIHCITIEYTACPGSLDAMNSAFETQLYIIYNRHDFGFGTASLCTLYGDFVVMDTLHNDLKKPNLLDEYILYKLRDTKASWALCTIFQRAAWKNISTVFFRGTDYGVLI